jgi:HPt (histidine-containing phosphotransfer) domain-containing protein
MESPGTGISPLVLNFPELLDRVDNDRDLLCELLGLFKEESSDLLGSLKRAVLDGDMKCVEMTGHTLKGMLANLSAKRGAAAAARIEEIGRARETWKLGDALVAFESEMALLIPNIDLYLEGAQQ